MTPAHQLILAREAKSLRKTLSKVMGKREKLRLITRIRHKTREFLVEQEKRVLDAFTARMPYIESDVRAFQERWKIKLQESIDDEMEELLEHLILTLFDADGETILMVTEILPLITEALRTGAEQAIKRINMKIGFDIRHEVAEKFLKDYGKSVVANFQGVSETTTQMIRTRLAGCVREGKNVQDMMDELKKVYGFSDYRAEMIARTEVTRAYRVGSFEADRELGVTQWNLIGCDSTCAICGDIMAHGPYNAEGTQEKEGQLHPNCKGDWDPVIDEDWEPRIYEEEIPEE